MAEPLNKLPRRGLIKLRSGEKNTLEDFALVSQLGFTMAGCIIFCFTVGYWLDAWLNAHGFLIAIGIILGVVGGGWTVFRQIQDLYKSDDKTKRNGSV